uniref:Uncharacterized protein n=1 Tax=viral metagenome TaxID=1070528 RepID=A0A6H1ZB49_9ZZZZ
MAINKRVPPNREGSFARNSAPYNVSFTAAAVTPCVGVVQDEGLVDSATGVTRTGPGTYVITFLSRFYRIVPLGPPNVQLTGNWDAKVLAVVDGAAAANSITVEVNNIGTAVADPTATVNVAFRIITSPGA